jgi:4-hydroxybenzoate-CoA ligase
VADIFTERRPYNAVSDFVDAHIAAGRGSKVAFVDPERSLTYGDLQARSVRFANALRDLGIDHEQRVALLLNDTVDYPVAFWGTLRAGCVAVPLNIYLTLPQYAYILADCRARALVIEASLLETIAPVLEKLPRKPAVIVVGSLPGHSGARAQHANPESSNKCCPCFWIPGPAHSASKTRVNALMRPSRNDAEYTSLP